LRRVARLASPPSVEGCFAVTRAWESGEELDLGSNENLELALVSMVRRVFEESSLSPLGPWSVRTEVDVDVDTRRVSLVIEITPAGACQSCGAALVQN
jgi:hypothetical protein